MAAQHRLSCDDQGGGRRRRQRNASGKQPAELKSSFETAQSEALRSFNDGEIYVEKFIENPRHIEIQVLGDEHGNVVYLGERECSVQRRHQKVIEEAPSAIVDEDMRRRMGAVAVQAAKSAGYTNAGTMEFLVDSKTQLLFSGNEYPPASGAPRHRIGHRSGPCSSAAADCLQEKSCLSARKTFTLRGHAIECRVYAEDPENNFFPSPGKITKLLRPSGPGVREDSGVYEGWTVPLDYDPMLSKLIVYAPDRATAIARMRRALDEYFIGGIKTNLPLFRRILEHPDFVAARIDTGFLDRLLATSGRCFIRN